MKVRLAAGLATVLSLVLAAPAMAADHDNGEGLLGELNDRIITFFSLGVVLFFFLVVCFGSWMQARLEKRKDARKAAELRQRIGW
jgi:hypothetical protein